MIGVKANIRYSVYSAFQLFEDLPKFYPDMVERVGIRCQKCLNLIGISNNRIGQSLIAMNIKFDLCVATKCKERSSQIRGENLV